MENEKDNVVNLKNTGEIELVKFDPKPFVGKMVQIDSVTEHKGQFGLYVKFEALVDPKGYNNEPLFASRIIGLQEDKDGNIGWGKETKMYNFLKKYGVKHYNDIKGVQVQLITKDDSSYLTF